RSEIAEESAGDSEPCVERHCQRLASAEEHRGQRNHDARGEPANVPADKSAEQAAFQAEINRLIAIAAENADGDAGAKDDRERQRELQALPQVAFLFEEKALDSGGTGENCRQ